MAVIGNCFVFCFVLRSQLKSGGETGPFRKTYVNTIAADALARGITRPSAAMVLIWNKHAPVIHVELVCFIIPQINQRDKD